MAPPAMHTIASAWTNREQNQPAQWSLLSKMPACGVATLTTSISTELNDRIETRALKLCFGERASRIPMSSTKSMVGHPQGASGAAGISAVLFAMSEGLIPPTLNLEQPGADCDLDYVPLAPRRAEVRYALANCIGFGSKNSALVLGKMER